MNTRPLAEFTDLTIVGTPADIRALNTAVTRAGVLIQRTAPHPAGPSDPRLRVTFRLALHR